MKLAQKTAFLVACEKDYVAWVVGVRQFFLCRKALQKLFHLPKPLPEKITVVLHDKPSPDRVSLYRDILLIKAPIDVDGVLVRTYTAFREWVSSHLDKHGTVYAEVWY